MNVVVFGVGALGELAHFYLTSDSSARVVAFTVDGAFVREPSFCGLPVVAFEDVATAFPPASHDLLVALGYSGVNRARADKMAAAERAGYRLSRYVSSRAHNLAAAVGDNALVFEGAILQPFSRLGRGVVVWSGAIVGHHSTVGDCAFLAPGAVLSGHVTLGARCFVGNGAAVRDGVHVGDGCILGLGAAVVADCAPDGIYLGVPARRVADADASSQI
jgi:sugar O-acyltransferase (sialic acid O-acetyltransferase NeuD family)